MINLEEIKRLDDKTLIELYKRVTEHINFLNGYIIEVVDDEEEGEGDG